MHKYRIKNLKMIAKNCTIGFIGCINEQTHAYINKIGFLEFSHTGIA